MGRTDELTVAWSQLRQHAAPGRFKVLADVEGFPLIRGKLGDIEWYHQDNTHLAAYTAGPTVRLGRLLSLPGIVRHQIGDSECRVLFPVGMLDRVAQVIRARRRRRLSPDQLAALRAGRAKLLRPLLEATQSGRQATETEADE